ncbi:MAG: GntR family transcriptional regulator [Ruminococcaceae bacterium]|nr:GntR family transcriptional regulator [Oscillospiraceae bacterium]
MRQKRELRPREEAEELIECYIRSQNLSPHDKLPSERSMCEMWDMNRSTLRTALRRLTEEGLLYSVLGSGTFVAPLKLERRLQDARSLTEAAKDAGRVLWSRVLEMELTTSDESVSKKLGCEPGHPIFYLRRLRMIDSVPFTIETCWLDHELCRGVEAHDFARESLYHVLEQAGVRLTHGRESIGITYANEEESRLLRLSEGDALFYLSGVSMDEGGRVVEAFKSVSLPDKVRFSGTLRRTSKKTEGSDAT